MKFSQILIALSVFSAVASAAPCNNVDNDDCSSVVQHPPPCETEVLEPPCEDDVPLGNPGSSVCEHGQWECQGNNAAQCNWGQWHVYECVSGTRCVPNDWECVYEADWQRVYDAFNPPEEPEEPVLSAPAPPSAPEGSCVNGEFQCYGDHVIQCNLGNWVIWPCAENTKCVPNDWECVPLSQWEMFNSRING